ncbi:MAG TPA: guanylate kinase [Clostridiaceae bacterium]|nr:guanylate kinase [Clostridiaceae bacterium]
MFQKGLLVVLSAPSGTGKSTVARLLVQRNSRLRLSVSATTREPRKGEVEGKDYFYKTVDEFKSMIENDEFVEWVEYCGNYYGTPKKYIEDSIENGFDVLLEIEVEGAAKIKEKYPDCVLIFMLPPSFDELKKRIEGRGTEKPEVIENRLNQARREIKCIDMYDYFVINDSIDNAINSVNIILQAEKSKVKRNKDLLEHIGFDRR